MGHVTFHFNIHADFKHLFLLKGTIKPFLGATPVPLTARWMQQHWCYFSRGGRNVCKGMAGL